MVVRTLLIGFTIVALCSSLMGAEQEVEPDLAVWLVTPDGNLEAFYGQGKLLEERWEPKSKGKSFSISDVTDLWLLYGSYRYRAYVMGDTVTAYTTFDDNTGMSIKGAPLPPLPQDLLADFQWPGEQEPIAKPKPPILEEKLIRSISTGFTNDVYETTDSLFKSSSTTQNLFVEYESDWRKKSNGYERSFYGRGRLGTSFNEIMIEQQVKTPRDKRRTYDYTASVSFDKEVDKFETDVDALTGNIAFSTRERKTEELDYFLDVSFDSLTYVEETTFTYDNYIFATSAGVDRLVGDLGVTAMVTWENASYPSDNGSDYQNWRYQLDFGGSRNKLQWDASMAHTKEDQPDGKLSRENETIADDNSEDELSGALVWTFSQKARLEFNYLWLDKRWEDPNVINYDGETNEFGPTAEFSFNDSSSLTLAKTWTRERYKKRDNALIDLGLEDNDNLNRDEIRADFRTMGCNYELSFGGTWANENFPNSDGTAFTANPNSKLVEYRFWLGWKIKKAWKASFDATFSTEKFEQRPEDNTRSKYVTIKLTYSY